MIEAAKEMLDLVKHMPEYTLWVLLGILFYKVVIVGGWISVARLLVNKVSHGYEKAKELEKVPPPPQVKQVEMNGKFILQDDTHVEFMNFLDEVINKRNLLRPPSKTAAGTFQMAFTQSYIHMDDVKWLKKILNEAYEREYAEIQVIVEQIKKEMNERIVK